MPGEIYQNELRRWRDELQGLLQSKQDHALQLAEEKIRLIAKKEVLNRSIAVTNLTGDQSIAKGIEDNFLSKVVNELTRVDQELVNCENDHEIKEVYTIINFLNATIKD